jgi:hypothetical protein
MVSNEQQTPLVSARQLCGARNKKYYNTDMSMKLQKEICVEIQCPY